MTWSSVPATQHDMHTRDEQMSRKNDFRLVWFIIFVAAGQEWQQYLAHQKARLIRDTTEAENLCRFTRMYSCLTFSDLSHFFQWESEEEHRLLESRFLGSNTYVCPLKSVWSRATYLTTLSLGFLICKMESRPFPPGINILMGIVKNQSPILSVCILCWKWGSFRGKLLEAERGDSFQHCSDYTARAQNREADHCGRRIKVEITILGQILMRQNKLMTLLNMSIVNLTMKDRVLYLLNWHGKYV